MKENEIMNGVVIERIICKVYLAEESDGTAKGFATMLDDIKPEEQDIALAVIGAKRDSAFARMVADEYRTMKGDPTALPIWF